MADETDNSDLESLKAELAAARARIKELNDESKGHRLNAQNARADADRLQKALDDAAKEHGLKMTAAEQARDQAIQSAKEAKRDAALRMAAKDAGIVDIDALRLLDTSGVTLDDDGSVAIPDGFWDQAKEAKPYLFAQAGTQTGTTSQTVKPPAQQPPKRKDALEMTPEEYAAFKKSVLGGR
jgi:hypothetical protein